MKISDHLAREMVDPKRELDAQLADVESTAQFVAIAVGLRPWLSKMLNWDHLSTEEKSLAVKFSELRDASNRTALVALIVICYGTLEKFVGELVERAVVAVNSGCREIENLPSSILVENIFRTGRVLQSVKSSKEIRSYDFHALSESLGSCRLGSSSFSLNAECFAYEHGIVSPENIDNVLGRLGISINWDKFGGNKEIKKILDHKRTRDCSKAVRSVVSDLVRSRNVVSHTGGLGLSKEFREIQKVTRLLPIFCAILVEEVGKQLDKMVE